MKKVPLIVTLTLAGLLTVGIMQTSQCNKNNNGAAIVSELPEVVEFRKAVEQSGRSSFHVRIASTDKEGDFIQVFEVFPDHQTTFGWYRYDPRTSSLYRQDIATDTWKKVK